MRFAYAIICALFLALSTVPAVAQQCTPIEKVVERIAVMEEVDKHVVLRGDDLKRALDIVVESGGPQFESAILVYMKDESAILLVGDKDNICGAMLVPKEHVRQFEERVRGRPA